MSTQASFVLRGRNPDVLTCIANLSNDEVFTPPEFANRMLDTLAEAWAAGRGGANLWADRMVTFLDPCTKSGVFLREITSRLTKGLEKEVTVQVPRSISLDKSRGIGYRMVDECAVSRSAGERSATGGRTASRGVGRQGEADPPSSRTDH
jgi:site-specific DNA-methyltransferase (adenine-specific)